MIEAASRKRLQVVFTTHSEYALGKLPPEAIWACVDGEAYQGRLSIESLRAIKGSAERDKVVFVEDAFAKDWVEDIFRQKFADGLSKAEIHVAGGYPYMVEVTNHHNKNPSIKKQAIAVVDGDSQVQSTEVIFSLPGEIPELEVFGYISEHVEELASLIQQRCHCPNLTQEAVTKCIEKTGIDVSDPHLLFRRLGERFGYLSEMVVRKAFISIYNEKNGPAIDGLAASLREFVLA